MQVYTVPGNHDIGDSPSDKTLSWYRKHVGKDWYSYDYSQWHFIGLNSCIIANDDNVLQEVEKQWNWLNNDFEQVASNKNSNIIIFMHHPLFLNEPEESDDYFNIPKQKRKVYLDLFQKYNIRTVFAGHLHQNNLTNTPELMMITSGPVGMPLGSAYSGFRVFKVYDDFIKHKYFGLCEKVNKDF